MDIKISAIIIAIVGMFFLKVSIDSNIFASTGPKTQSNTRIFKKTS